MLSQLRGNKATAQKKKTRLGVLLQEPTHLTAESMRLIEELGNVTRGVLDQAMAFSGNKQGLVGLQNAEHILAPHAEVIQLAIQKLQEDLASHPSPLTERKLNQLSFQLVG